MQTTDTMSDTERDAERYRFLRDKCKRFSSTHHKKVYWRIITGWMTGNNIDDAIDEMMNGRHEQCANSQNSHRNERQT